MSHPAPHSTFKMEAMSDCLPAWHTELLPRVSCLWWWPVSGHQLAAWRYRGSHFFSLLSAHCTASPALLCCGRFPPPQGCWMQTPAWGNPAQSFPCPQGEAVTPQHRDTQPQEREPPAVLHCSLSSARQEGDSSSPPAFIPAGGFLF